MAFEPDTGFGAIFKISTDTATNAPVTLGSLKDLDWDFSIGESDVSSLEDATTYSSFLPTRTSYTISGTVNFDPGSAEHELTILDNLNLKRFVEITFTDHSTVPSVWTGTAFFTSFSPSISDDGMTASFSMRGTGPPTFAGVA